MKKYLICLIAFLPIKNAFCQTNCNTEFSGVDVLKWRIQLKFTPKYLDKETLDYLITRLSDRAYTQLHIEISVRCDDKERKNITISNMKYYWNNAIPEEKLIAYFPAYYVFYKLDKSEK